MFTEASDWATGGISWAGWGAAIGGENSGEGASRVCFPLDRLGVRGVECWVLRSRPPTSPNTQLPTPNTQHARGPPPRHPRPVDPPRPPVGTDPRDRDRGLAPHG